MRVFLDVGAHTGQSLLEARRWDFDRIVSFEPASQCWPMLDEQAARDPRVTIERFGLFSKQEQRTLYLPSSKGAGLWWRERKHGGEPATQPCSVVRASDWFAEHLSPSDVVFAKLNCEGSEVPILNDLLDSGEFGKVTRALVRLDAMKIPEIAYESAALLTRLAQYIESGVVCVKRRQLLRGWLENASGAGLC